jgi:hypothetical protein
LVVFSAGFAVVHILYRTFDFKINQLSNRHAGIDTNRFYAGDFQCPCIAITDISFSCGGMDVNAKTSYTGFSFEKRNGAMGLCVFFSYAQV